MVCALTFTALVSGCKSNPSPQPAAQTSTQNPSQPTSAGQPAPAAAAPAAASQAPAGAGSAPQDQSAQGALPASAPAQVGSAAAGGAAAATAPQEPQIAVIPAGTPLRVRLDETLSSKQNQPGDSFTATIEAPVVVHGQTVIKRGSTATGTVVDAKALGHIKGGAVLSIRLDRVRAGGRSYPVATSMIERVEQGKGKRSGEFAGGGAGLGALIGGLAGGGKGAIIGGLAGAGAGTAGGAMTGNKEIVLPAETMLTFRTTGAVRVE